MSKMISYFDILCYNVRIGRTKDCKVQRSKYMRISIVAADGTTTYTQNMQPSAVSDANFATALDAATAANSSATDSSSALSDTSALSSVMSLEDIFNEAAQTYQVDVNLLTAMAKQESNFQADATSSSGAMGIMQLMPATAEGLGVSDAYDAYENIMGGAKYISQLLERYNGDTSLALAAYNADSGNVAKYGGIPPFTETQNYVSKVLSYYEEGIDVPDTTVVRSTLTKEQAAANLETLLSEFPDHASYQAFWAQMNDLMDSATRQSQLNESQEAYEQLLSNVNQAVRNLLSEE